MFGVSDHIYQKLLCAQALCQFGGYNLTQDIAPPFNFGIRGDNKQRQPLTIKEEQVELAKLITPRKSTQPTLSNGDGVSGSDI